MRRVFLSYRTADIGLGAGRVRRIFAERFGNEAVWRDADSIPPGADFVVEIGEAINRCDAMVVLIGPRWADDGILEVNDWPRMEVEAALRRGIDVFPLLLQGARMPTESQLPDSLHALLRRQKRDIRDDPHFDNDLGDFVSELRAMPPGSSRRNRRSPARRHFPKWARPIVLVCLIVIASVTALKLIDFSAITMPGDPAPFVPDDPRQVNSDHGTGASDAGDAPRESVDTQRELPDVAWSLDGFTPVERATARPSQGDVLPIEQRDQQTDPFEPVLGVWDGRVVMSSSGKESDIEVDVMFDFTREGAQTLVWSSAESVVLGVTLWEIQRDLERRDEGFEVSYTSEGALQRGAYRPVKFRFTTLSTDRIKIEGSVEWQDPRRTTTTFFKVVGHLRKSKEPL